MSGEFPSNWSTLRREVMNDADGICEVGGPECEYVAVEVDHIVAREHGGGHERENLRAICKACHLARRPGKGGPKKLPMTRTWW